MCMQMVQEKKEPWKLLRKVYEKDFVVKNWYIKNRLMFMNWEQRTKNKEQSLYSWKNKEQKMSQLVTVIPSVLFIEGNKHYRKMKH